MNDAAIESALRLFLSARKKFDEGDFASATLYSKQFEDLNYAFANIEFGENFSWARHTVCIVSYKSLAETEALLKGIAPLTDDSEFCLLLVENAANDLFPYADEVTRGAFAKIRSGANFGASVGRNLAIHFSESETITFLDDDGITGPASITKLVNSLIRHDAVAVRGRVLPLQNLDALPKHYDLGNNIKQRFMDIEGITVWKTDALKRHRFDPLLYGHEGLELTARLYREYGPDAFLYEPDAILRHDFVKPEAVINDKLERMNRNSAYIEYINKDISSVKSVFYGLDTSTQSARSLHYRREMVSGKIERRRAVSFLTTCLNSASYLIDYCDALDRQTCQNFEIIFVDDGSTDGSADIVAERFRGDSRLKLIRSDHIGRAAALNLAMGHVQTELALIADADDISVPQRVEWTQKAFDMYGPADIIGFTIFDSRSPTRGSRPLVSRPTPINVRRFFGMPCPFPGVSFKPSSFSLPFDETLSAGIDCDWLYRNIEQGRLKGWYLPVPVTFYRTHDGQITASRRDLQRTVSITCVRNLHSQLIAPFEPEDQEGLELFTGWRPINNGASWFRMKEYANRLISRLDTEKVPESEFLQDEIIRHLEERHLSLSLMDYNKLKAKAARPAATVANEDSARVKELNARIAELKSKLDWNRKRVSKLEDELAKRPTPEKFGELEAKLAWNRERVRELEGNLRRTKAAKTA